MNRSSLLLLTVLFAASPALASVDSKAEGNPSAALYSKNCASCHGADAHGKATMAKVLKVELAALDLLSAKAKDAKAEDLKTVVENGRGKMPAYGKKLTGEEIAGLLGYLHSLREPGEKKKD